MKKVPLLIAFLYLLILVNCNQEAKLPENYQAEVCAELSDLTQKSMEVWENEDLETYMSYLDNDIINMYSYGMSTNFEENRQAFKDLFDTYSIEDVEIEVVECFADHNYAFVVGMLDQKWISNDKQDTIVTEKARALTVHKKQEDGKWKMFRIFVQQPMSDGN